MGDKIDFSIRSGQAVDPDAAAKKIMPEEDSRVACVSEKGAINFFHIDPGRTEGSR